MFSSQTYIARRQKLRKSVKSGIIILLGNQEASANYPANTYHFRQDSTFLYYFGLNQPDYVGIIDIDNDTECLFADDYTIDDVIWMGKLPSVKELAASVGVKTTYPKLELQRVVNAALRKGRKVHFLPPYRLTNTVVISDLIGVRHLRVKDYVSAELVAAVIAQREIKSDEEIEQIENACDIAYNMHTTAMQMCRAGIFERDIAGTIEGIALREGAGVSFLPIVTINGQTLHNHYYGNKLADGRMLLIDAGAETTMNYCSDFTRTIPVSGKYSERQKEVYDIVLAANRKAYEVSRAGITYREVHLEALKVLGRGLHSLGLIKGDVDEAVAAGAVALFMPHGLGHQMGLDVHDMEDLGEKLVGYDAKTERSTQFGLASLRMGKTLREGHVITVEPGLYFIPDLVAKWKNEQINSAFINFQKVEQYFDFGGVRIENNMLITSSGNRELGRHHTPITTDEIETLMANN